MSGKPLVVGGKLKLKGSSSSKAAKKEPSQSSSTESAIGKKRSSEEAVGGSSEGSSSSSSHSEGKEVHLTEAQRRFKEKKRALEEKRVKQLAKTTLRDRIDDFNAKLSRLTEHNDIPRVSAAGNG
eukprot:gene1414-1538_t